MIERGSRSTATAEELWIMCSRDMLFWMNTFAWLYEPRIAAVLPFVTYPYQDETLSEMDRAIGKYDLVIPKSRTMGVTWMFLAVFAWHWQFHPMRSFLLLSRTEDLVDKTDDPDSLFWKMDFLLEKQPGWMLPNLTRSKLRLTNRDNGSTITGASTTGNVGRGGRRTSIAMDEVAAWPAAEGYAALHATQPVTECRILPSTPQGVGNAFADLNENPNLRKVRQHWSIHPVYNRGLYTSEGGKLKILDDSYDYPPDYDFLLDGKLRSPWYDKECKRAGMPQLIAQELDIDFQSSGFRLFPAELIDKHRAQFVRPPYIRGELKYDKRTGEPDRFVESEDGRLHLWLTLDMEGRPPKAEYGIGVDVSAGTGASNSCLYGANKTTGEQVAELATPFLGPDDLAAYAAALGRWLGRGDDRKPLIVAESNGGLNVRFHKALLGMGYGRVYYKKDERVPAGKVSEVPGWGSTPTNKREMLENFQEGLKTEATIVRSEECLRESERYIFFPDHTVGHSRSRNKLDPSGAAENHGDRLMAGALCCHGMGKTGRLRAEAPKIIPVNSFMARRQRRVQEKKRQDSWLRVGVG